ncbi:MAG: DUF3566 domain-containing protein [Trueperella sp.]|nr:DUF3566 domain-containing protein [Trueperella sp.]
MTNANNAPADSMNWPKPGDTATEAAAAQANAVEDSGAAPSRVQQREAAKREVGIRRARMTLSRIEPWSALKMSFLLSVALGIMIVIAAMVLWVVLDVMQVWGQIDELLVTLNSEALLNLGQFLHFGRVLAFAVVVGVIEIVLFTALGTLMALIYNVIATLVGGISITVTDE